MVPRSSSFYFDEEHNKYVCWHQISTMQIRVLRKPLCISNLQYVPLYSFNHPPLKLGNAFVIMTFTQIGLSISFQFFYSMSDKRLVFLAQALSWLYAHINAITALQLI